jgi:GGDEF domain-containing protein
LSGLVSRAPSQSGVAGRTRPHVIVKEASANNMDKRISLLRALDKSSKDRLEPREHVTSPFGYVYPLALQVLRTTPGKEIEELERLADMGYLERQYFDRVHLCPRCFHFAINFREVCPECKSSDVRRIDMIHHLRCGSIAPETEHVLDGRLVCPKCSKELRHVGVDYERPSSRNLCNSCKSIFADPLVMCRSLKCRHEFDADALDTRQLYTYGLTESGARAAASGVLEESTLINQQTGLYTANYFRERLKQEIDYYRRYQTPAVAMLVKVKGNNGVSLDESGISELTRRLARLTKKSIRDCDVAARAESGSLSLLFPKTDKEQAGKVINRIRREFGSMVESSGLSEMVLEIGIATPLRTDSVEQMLRRAEQDFKGP